MTVPSRSDLLLVLMFCVVAPLAAGGWWRFFSGYEMPQGTAIVEPAPAAENNLPEGAERDARRAEKETHTLLAWTTGTGQLEKGRAEQQGPTTGRQQSLSGNEEEQQQGHETHAESK